MFKDLALVTLDNIVVLVKDESVSADRITFPNGS
jgi:hypothetical protein